MHSRFSTFILMFTTVFTAAVTSFAGDGTTLVCYADDNFELRLPHPISKMKVTVEGEGGWNKVTVTKQGKETLYTSRRGTLYIQGKSAKFSWPGETEKWALRCHME